MDDLFTNCADVCEVISALDGIRGVLEIVTAGASYNADPVNAETAAAAFSFLADIQGAAVKWLSNNECTINSTLEKAGAK